MTPIPLIIDPPVTPGSPPAELRAWLEELDRIRQQYATNSEALELIGHLERQAQGWLERAERRGGSAG